MASLAVSPLAIQYTVPMNADRPKPLSQCRRIFVPSGKCLSRAVNSESWSSEAVPPSSIGIGKIAHPAKAAECVSYLGGSLFSSSNENRTLKPLARCRARFSLLGLLLARTDGLSIHQV